MHFLKNTLVEKSNQLFFILSLLLTIHFIPLMKYKITALFLFTISNFIFKIFDSGVMTLISMSIGLMLNIFPPDVLLQAFCQPIIWQIMCFLFLSRALIKSGLAHKISIYIVYFFGQSTLTLCFGFCFLTVFFALLLPTSTARIGGIFIPIVASIFNILPKNDQNLKDTIIKVIVYSNTIASAMFFNASSTNFYIQEITKTINCFISAQCWIINGFVPGLICLISTTLLIHTIMNPNSKNLKKINKKIEEEMIGLDSLSTQEVLILLIFIGIFPLWFIAPKFNTPFLGILFTALCILFIFDQLNFEEDILHHTEAWSLFFWMSNLLMLSSLITQYDAFNFLNALYSKLLLIMPPHMTLLFILIFYGYSQYLFASSTVHASALYVICFNMAVQYGYSPFFSALLLAYVSNLFSGLTTYSASEVILLTESFNCEPKRFNKCGFLISSFIFILWLVCGSIWWKITGVL